jgi:uncharacterized membrane protein
MSSALVRVSGCCVLRTLFNTARSYRNTIRATLVLCILHGIASVLEVCLICQPLAAQWDPNVKGLCGNQIVSFVVIEVAGLVLDLVILLTPLYMVLRSQMNRGTKLKAVMILDAGFV